MSLHSLESTLTKLVSFNTTQDNKEQVEACFYWIKEQLKHIPLVTRFYSSNGCDSLVITTQDTLHPTIFLSAHVDVVPADEFQFHAHRKDTRLHGRGVYDMKFAIAMYMHLLDDLCESIGEYDIGLMLTSDEEKGGWNGTRYLVEDVGYSADVCFIPDGGESWQIETEVKGLWLVQATSHGLAVHASRPWEGSNAIHSLTQFLNVIDTEIFIPCYSEPRHLHRTLTVGQLFGGHAPNVVADTASAMLDVRFVSASDLEDIQESIQGILKRGNFNIDIETKVLANSFSIDLDSKEVQEFISCMPSKYQKDQHGFISHGSSDARFFAAKGIPVIETRPDGHGHHSENEWIDIEDLELFFNTLKKYVEKVARI